MTFENFTCPLVTEVLKVVLDTKKCLDLFDAEDLIGCTRDALKTNARKDGERIATELIAANEVLSIVGNTIGIDQATTALFVAFEAGRRFEREKISIDELTRMMGE